MLLNPGSPGRRYFYLLKYLWATGWHVGGLQANRHLPRGSSLAARWSPASLGILRSGVETNFSWEEFSE
jgi:hypothetical protein